MSKVNVTIDKPRICDTIYFSNTNIDKEISNSYQLTFGYYYSLNFQTLVNSFDCSSDFLSVAVYENNVTPSHISFQGFNMIINC